MIIDVDTLLALGAAYKKVKVGELIFMEGTECYFYHQLVSGSVRWTNIDEEGNEFIQNLITPGECFGELPLFDNAPFAASAIADTDSIILRLHKSSFLNLIMERSDIHFRFTTLMAERLRFKFLLIKDLANHNPEKCIITLLGYLKNQKKYICSFCNKVKLTRQQIANMTGFRVETVIRTMRHMQEEGKLLIEKGKVYCRQ